MQTVKQFIADQKERRFSRGLPSSRKLHNLEVRRDRILEKRDWFDAKREAAEEKAKGDNTVLQRAIAGIFFVANKFRPWQKKRAK